MSKLQRNGARMFFLAYSEIKQLTKLFQNIPTNKLRKPKLYNTVEENILSYHLKIIV